MEWDIDDDDESNNGSDDDDSNNARDDVQKNTWSVSTALDNELSNHVVDTNINWSS